MFVSSPKKRKYVYRLTKLPRLFNNSELFFDIKSAHEKTLSYKNKNDQIDEKKFNG